MDEARVKEEVWAAVRAMNRAWTVDGDCAKLKEHFHRDMVAITPAANGRIVGREACVAGWDGFVKMAKIRTWAERDPDIRIHCGGAAAVVTYYYDMDVEIGRQELHLEGRDMFFMVREDGEWLAAADQFSSFPFPG